MKKYNVIFYGLVLSLAFSSCNSMKSYRNFNYFNGVDYYNDSLGVSGTFFGDILIFDESDVSTYIIKPYSKKDLLVYGKSEGEYAMFLFVNKRNKKDSIRTSLISNDKENQQVIYEKVGNQNKLTLLLKNSGQKRSNTTILRDGNTIINSMKFDSSRKNKLTYIDIFNTYRNENNFLYVLNKLDNAPIVKTKKNESEKRQLTSTLLSNDSGSDMYRVILRDFEKTVKKRQQRYIDSILKKSNTFSDFEAIEKITELSKESKIMMLNENHWKPNHRIMAFKLLKPLRNNGYKYLAVEAVDKEQDSMLNSRKYPVKSTGYYTRESYFGLFLREAKNLGYTIVGYDDFGSNREELQAKNIKNILEADKTAKIFVYAGFDHILEFNPSKKRMAEYFQEITSINPITINQVEIVADIANELTLIDSKYFEQAEKVNTNVDFFLINNIVPNLNSLFENTKLSSILINDNILKDYIYNEILISVYYQHEYEKYKSNSIPILNKIVHLNDYENSILVHLPNSKFIVKIMDGNNNLILLKEIEVK